MVLTWRCIISSQWRCCQDFTPVMNASRVISSRQLFSTSTFYGKYLFSFLSWFVVLVSNHRSGIPLILVLFVNATLLNQQYQSIHHSRLSSLCKQITMGVPHPMMSVDGCSTPLLRPWARRWINHWSLLQMASAMPDLWLPSQPKTLLPCYWYKSILLGDRGTYVWTTCPRSLSGSRDSWGSNLLSSESQARGGWKGGGGQGAMAPPQTMDKKLSMALADKPHFKRSVVFIFMVFIAHGSYLPRV